MLPVLVFQHAYFHEGDVQLVLLLLISIKQLLFFSFHAHQERFLGWIKPPTTSLVLATRTDLTRGTSVWIAENAILRQQLTILHRQIKRTAYKKTDRLLLVLLARLVRTWKQALVLVQPKTLL
jgi:putative transposase